MRWLRLLSALIFARFRSKISLTEVSKLNFHVWLNEIDVSIMNHAALLTIMEMGRIDFMVRSGFFKLAQQQKWYFPSRSISVQFFRPLKIFQKATLHTRLFYVDDRWIYLEQKIRRKDKDIAVAIIKSTVKKGKDPVNVFDILQQMGVHHFQSKGHDLIKAYEQQNSLMGSRIL